MTMKSTKKLTIPKGMKLNTIKRSESQKQKISKAFNNTADQFDKSMKNFDTLLSKITD